MKKRPIDDALSNLEPLLRVRPELQDLCRFGGDWISPHEAAGAGCAHFHIVTRGECFLGAQPRLDILRLAAGDILLLPHGDPHVMHAGAASNKAAQPIATHYRNAIRTQTSVGVEPATELICGRLHFEAAQENPLIAALPGVIVIHAAGQPMMSRFWTLMTAIRDELDTARAGAMAIATNLASAMFIMMLRKHLEDNPPVEGLLSLLSHRTTSQAVLAILRNPSYNWTLDELADRAATSRATLVRSFRRIAGTAPLAFLTELRLSLAQQRLKTTADPIRQIAAGVGYQSEAAMSRAFYRRFHIRPGELRRAGRG